MRGWGKQEGLWWLKTNWGWKRERRKERGEEKKREKICRFRKGRKRKKERRKERKREMMMMER